MKNYLLLLCCAISCTLFAQNSLNNAVVDNNTISVIGVGTKTTFPNAAHITISVRFVKPALREAMNETQKTTKEVISIIKKYFRN
jgi:uncharacterized protein YggE